MLNRLEMMRIFCAAAEASSFKEAAARLGVSPQAVTRAVKELEHKVGEPLFYRNTRQMRITDFGEQLANRARDKISGIDDLFKSSDKQPDADIAGIVRITAPTTIGRRFLLPILNKIAVEHPHIILDLRLSDMITNVVEQQIDIGVRVGFLRDSSFVARATSKISFFVVASPELIARVGNPASTKALLELPAIALVDKSSGKPWPWYFSDDQQFVPRTTAFITDDAETELNLVLNGIGFGQIADFLTIPHIRAGRLVRVLEEHTPPPWDLYVYRPQRGPVPARIRIVYDQILVALSDPSFFLSVSGMESPEM
jgi:DNA-binding transcriptional LysR family regulator